MRKVLLLILALTIFLVSCLGNTEEKLRRKLDKTLDKNVGYQAELELRICGEKDSFYKLQENYINDNEIQIEILEPKGNNDITIEYKDGNIHLKNASIEESTSLKEIEEIDRGLLYGEIFTSKKDIISIKEEEVKGTNYYIVENDLKDPNKYSQKKYIYLNTKDLTPEMMVIVNGCHEERIIIKYNNFKYIEK